MIVLVTYPPLLRLYPVEQHIGTIEDAKEKEEKTSRGGRGAYIGNRVSKLIPKVKKGSFCEENHYKKVVQFL